MGVGCWVFDDVKGGFLGFVAVAFHPLTGEIFAAVMSDFGEIDEDGVAGAASAFQGVALDVAAKGGVFYGVTGGAEFLGTLADGYEGL